MCSLEREGQLSDVKILTKNPSIYNQAKWCENTRLT